MEKRGDAIILIGFMGAGKSCTGVELCRRTNYPAFDTDAMVVARRDATVAEIFERLGEDFFRDEETAALRTIPGGPSIIITGGGCILREENVELLRALGTIVWLRADQETIFRRIGHRDDRPLLRGSDRRKRIAELMAARDELYSETADIELDTALLSPAEVADAILEAVAHTLK